MISGVGKYGKMALKIQKRRDHLSDRLHRLSSIDRNDGWVVLGELKISLSDPPVKTLGFGLDAVALAPFAGESHLGGQVDEKGDIRLSPFG